MPKFFNSDMADLTHQLTLAPRRLRVEQIRGIDKLLGAIEEDRAYPFEFVCHAITRYRKRGSAPGPLVPGKALIADLVTMAEIISRKANLKEAELNEPCRTQVQLADDLKISTKTIRRWRNRGLMGVRVTYKDGVNRLAFCSRSVKRFVTQHKDLVARGAAFKQLSASERQSIVDRAREILSIRPAKLHSVARIISEETGRAVETVRYTLRRHDESNTEVRLFGGDGASAYDVRQTAMWRSHKAGDPVDSIARAFNCTVESVQQVLREVQVREWQAAPLEWMHNELFDAPGAEALILDVPEPSAAEPSKARTPKDLPAYLRALYMTPLLSREQEQDLFRRYNYLKCKTAGAVRRLDPEVATAADVERVRSVMSSIDALKRRIVGANLRLVVSIAKKHVGWSPNFFEIISDGNVSLMRAAEKFDYARGNKFSTYASWAIMKNYARSIPEKNYHCTRFVTGQEAVLEGAADHRPEPESQSDRSKVREMLAAGLNELTDREREIVCGHFGLADKAGPLTLQQLGYRFGVTKERIRQIEHRALTRLREVLSPSLLDAAFG